jgi:hypothetical protein
MKWSFLLSVLISSTSFGQVNKTKDLMQKLKLSEQLRKGYKPYKELVQSEPQLKHFR